MHREITAGTLGRATIEPTTPVVAGCTGTWRVTCTAGPGGIKPGGTIRFTIPHGFSTPQDKAFFDPGFTSIEHDVPGLETTLAVQHDIFCRLDPATGHSGAMGRSVFVRVGEPGLRDGQSITLVYGNADYYGGEPFSHAGARARELAGPAEFTVAVDPDGTRAAPYSGYARIAASPSIDVVHGPVTRIIARAPSDAIRGHEIPVRVLRVDRYNTPVSVETRSCRVAGAGAVACARVDVDGTTIETNPIRLHDHSPETRILWGDIHGHTIHSDGLGSVVDYYTFARDVASLDFAAITDHDDIGPRLFDDEWETITRAARDFHEPGRFVTFLGHEYRNGACDMNVYHPGDEGPLLRGTDGDLGDAAVLTARVKARGGMIVPHMHFGADWSGMDPEVYRVAEIYSSHGSAECKGCPREIPYLRKQVQKSSKTNKDGYIHDALMLGHRLGFTAGSDTHSGRPGFSDWTRVCRTYPGGLTAVLATGTTRAAIWEALRERRCYATTGNRSLVEFSINGAGMGSEISIGAGDPRTIAVACHADGILKAMTVYRSGAVLAREGGLTGVTFSRTLVDAGRDGPDWYHVRFDLEGGEMAWSSPVWVDRT